MDPTTVYFVGNRLWWSVALFLSPIAGAIAGQPAVAFLAAAVLVLPWIATSCVRGWPPPPSPSVMHLEVAVLATHRRWANDPDLIRRDRQSVASDRDEK